MIIILTSRFRFADEKFKEVCDDSAFDLLVNGVCSISPPEPFDPKSDDAGEVLGPSGSKE